jgi:hypothetical protein
MIKKPVAIEKRIDEEGIVWFKNTFLPWLDVKEFTAKMLVDGCRCGKVSIPYDELPQEVSEAVEAEERRQFASGKQPIYRKSKET